MALITYDDKVALNENPSIADINKVKAGDMNEIKSVVNGLIVNSSSNSTTNTYSCDYSNKAFGGTILWTNPDPSASPFGSQNITLNSNDYDLYEIIYNVFGPTSTISIYDSSKSIKGVGTNLMFGGFLDKRRAGSRTITYVNDITLNVGSCYLFSSSDDTTDNARCIPLYIIGYKTGLF